MPGLESTYGVSKDHIYYEPADADPPTENLWSTEKYLDHMRTGSRGATDLSPVCMGAALHFDLWAPNFGIQEYMRHTEETDAVFPHGYRFADGCLHPGEAPGHGVDIDETLAAKYPYRRAYLPINRLEDGTMYNW